VVVVVVRDVEVAEREEMMEEARRLLMKDMKECWGKDSSDSSSSNSGDGRREDVVLEVVALPHHRYQKKEFDEGVRRLQGLFKDHTTEKVGR